MEPLEASIERAMTIPNQPTLFGWDFRRPKWKKKASPLVTIMADGSELDEFSIEQQEQYIIEHTLGEMIHGRRSGRYKLARKLGEGGMGQVWLGMHEQEGDIDRPVALKFLSFADKNHEEQFIEEAKLTTKLRHPNILHSELFDKTKNLFGGEYFLGMDFVRGRDLDGIMKDFGIVPKKGLENLSFLRTRRAIQIPWQLVTLVGFWMADALKYAHKPKEATLGHAVIHRDIKPDNIFVGEEGHTRLADFGVAAIMSDEKRRKMVSGTPGFIPPEAFEVEMVDTRADIFSLGTTLYYLATGINPFKYYGDWANMKTQIWYQRSAALETILPPHELVENIPEGFSHLVMPMIANIEDRVSTMHEVKMNAGNLLYNAGFGATRESWDTYLQIMYILIEKNIPLENMLTQEMLDTLAFGLVREAKRTGDTCKDQLAEEIHTKRKEYAGSNIVQHLKIKDEALKYTTDPDKPRNPAVPSITLVS